MRLTRRALRFSVWSVFALMGVVLAAYVALLIFRPTNQYSTMLDGWGVDAFELIAGGLCVLGGARRRPRSAVPIILGVALACWALGDVVTTIESLGGATPASPSLADGFYLLFFPLSYGGVVLFVRRETSRLRSSSWLDAAVAGLGASAVCAAFAFATIVHSTGESGLAAAVNLAYPVGDVLLLLLVVGGSAVMSDRRKAAWLLIAAGLAVNVFGDTANLLQDSVGASHPGIIINAVAWPTSSLLISMAMWLRPRPINPLALVRAPSFLLPGLAAGAGLVVLFVSTLSPVARVATALATATLLLVVLRTWLSVRHMRAESNVRQRLSVTDPLTGLANRRRLFDTLDAHFAQASADRPGIAFLFIDLNGFKQINDCFGHPVGDEVLKRVTARLEQPLRPTDLLVRLGGDEFVAVLIGAGADQATAVAARLSASLDEPFALDAVNAAISASIGIALAPADAADGDDLMRCADAAMYRAKLASKRFALFEPADRGTDKLQLADELSAAIAEGQLVLHYQPQLNLHTGAIASVEALVRWEHPERGLIQPLTFLPLAEETGMMSEITHWVLAEALAQCAAWHATGQHVRVSVNVSVSDLTDPDFPGTVAALVARHRLPAEASLMLEITETSVIEDFERAKHAVTQLRERGIQVSIDDFGAGFTSLAYLNELAIGEMKLDRRFIAPLAAGVRSRDSELVRATIELGHALGLQVVAEGIEADDTLELLRQLGCDIAQGYWIGRPVPAAEINPDCPQRPLSQRIRTSMTAV